MSATVKSRLTHYETLGVSPLATVDEILRAFASKSGAYRPHAFGSLAELCVALETLRDPIKRQAYDASIGVRRDRPRPSFAAGASWATVGLGVAAGSSTERQNPLGTPPGRSLNRTPDIATPALPLATTAESHVSPPPRIGRGDASSLLPEQELGSQARPVDWKRAGIVLGAVVLLACFLGGFAGWWSASSISEAATPEISVSLSLPAAEPQPSTAIPDPLPAPATDRTTETVGHKPALANLALADPLPPVPETATADEVVQEGEAQPSPVEQPDPLAPAASPSLAAMPLPNNVIARTIRQIGYSCPSIASIEQVEGEAAGVHKVTCTSGQSYRASPVNGRYRFRRLGRQ